MCQFQLDTSEVTVTTQCLVDVTVVSDRSISSSHGPYLREVHRLLSLLLTSE